MMSLSHWGMFDASDVRYVLWPLRWANFIDTQFSAIMTPGWTYFFMRDEVHVV